MKEPRSAHSAARLRLRRTVAILILLAQLGAIAYAQSAQSENSGQWSGRAKFGLSQHSGTTDFVSLTVDINAALTERTGIAITHRLMWDNRPREVVFDRPAHDGTWSTTVERDSVSDGPVVSDAGRETILSHAEFWCPPPILLRLSGSQ
jgi:hypothetical protein